MIVVVRVVLLLNCYVVSAIT